MSYNRIHTQERSVCSEPQSVEALCLKLVRYSLDFESLQSQWIQELQQKIAADPHAAATVIETMTNELCQHRCTDVYTRYLDYTRCDFLLDRIFRAFEDDKTAQETLLRCFLVHDDQRASVRYTKQWAKALINLTYSGLKTVGRGHWMAAWVIQHIDRLIMVDHFVIQDIISWGYHAAPSLIEQLIDQARQGHVVNAVLLAHYLHVDTHRFPQSIDALCELITTAARQLSDDALLFAQATDGVGSEISVYYSLAELIKRTPIRLDYRPAVCQQSAELIRDYICLIITHEDLYTDLYTAIKGNYIPIKPLPKHIRQTWELYDHISHLMILMLAQGRQGTRDLFQVCRTLGSRKFEAIYFRCLEDAVFRYHGAYAHVFSLLQDTDTVVSDVAHHLAQRALKAF